MNDYGEAIIPLEDDAISTVVQQVQDAGVSACAVCLLFSFLNPSHEQRIAAALRAAMPDLLVSLSSEVQPEFREYERFSTTLLNAYLQPVMGRYMAYLERELGQRIPQALVGINQSSGGLMSVARARDFPIRTALSGPAAGAVGAIHIARLSDQPNAITLDMGGTSADVCMIQHYAADIGFGRDVARFPVRLPSVDINTVGAGGGSIAWFDRDGLLKVGPHSAGADPGPACYGRSGVEPTVTDANILLGRLSPAGLLGGAMAVDMEAARKAFEPMAASMGFSVEKTAHGILEIVTANMVRAIRAISVERGHDPRDCTLMPFGGAGPLHATPVARALGMQTILVPLSPGILCAQGLVVSDLQEEIVRSKRLRVDENTLPEMRALIEELHTEAEQWFAAEGVAPARRALQLSLDMRYVGQNFELRVAIGEANKISLPDTASLRDLFAAAHERNYGFFNHHDPIEVINFRLTARGRLGIPPPARVARAEAIEPQPSGRRAIYFAADAPLDAAVYQRAELAPGHIIRGPAVIEQLDATTLVFPDDTATVDAALNLFIEVAL